MEDNTYVKKISLKELKRYLKDWCVLPNLSYSFYVNWNKTILKKLKGNKNLIYCYFEDKNPTMLLFLEKNKSGEVTSANLLDYFDIIVLKDNNEGIKDFIKKIMEIEKVRKLTFNNCQQESVLLKTFNNIQTIKKEICVKIEIDKTYDSYYQRLTKSSRQNLRTAYNRLVTDGKTFKFEYYENPDQISKFKATMKKIYVNRTKEKNNLNFLKRIFYYNFEPVVDSISKTKNLSCGCIFVDNKMAGYFLGLRNNNEIIIPRLSIDLNYSRYSVGNILINETIKHLIKENKYNVFDLAQGNENYKYVMGGIEHYKFSFEVGIEELWKLCFSTQICVLAELKKVWLILLISLLCQMMLKLFF